MRYDGSRGENGSMRPLLEAPPKGGGFSSLPPPPSPLLSPLPLLLLLLSPFILSSLPSPLFPLTDLQCLAYRPHPRVPQLVALEL